MFGLLKKKLSKAIKSISEKIKEKEEVEPIEKVEEKIEEVEKKIEEVEKEVEEAVEPAIEEPSKPIGQSEPEIIKAPEIIKPRAEVPKAEIKKPKKKSFIKKAFERVTKRIVERKLDETDLLPVLAELETDLIESDVAVETAERIKANLLKELTGKEIKRGKEKDAIIGAFRKSLMDILTVQEIDLKKIAGGKRPVVLLFLGFNGSGKTTSIAKLANWLKEQKLTCVLAAADTFRAASLEQLEEHADKIGVRMVKHKYGADPAAVIYDAIMHAKAKRLNFVLADTAGRVHTNQDLMEEMKKIIRVNRPDLKILVIDSLTGNDAVLQARAFGELDMDAVIFTKVDVNEKGGAILSVTNELKKPILFLGLGQEYGDFERFDAGKFVNNLLA